MTPRAERHSVFFALGVAGVSVACCFFLRELALQRPGVVSHAVDWICPLLGVLMLVILVLAGAHLRARRWWLALGSVVSVAITALCSVVVVLLADFDATFADEDHFADDLVIPPDLVLREPDVPAYGSLVGHPERGAVVPPRDAPTETTASRASLNLSSGMQPGNYHVIAMVNPGEPGTAYVRAFEVTRGVELSVREMRRTTTRQLAGSADPTELFRYEAPLTIAEGNWGQHYAARFQLWFAPASGATPRVLVSDLFRIEGWMR